MAVPSEATLIDGAPPPIHALNAAWNTDAAPLTGAPAGLKWAVVDGALTPDKV